MRSLIALITLAGASTALAGPVSLNTADGVTLNAVEYGSGAKGVVLVHSQRRSAEDWARFADGLASRGFHVVAVDLRGHGASAAGIELTAETWPAMLADVTAATSWIRAQGATEVHLIGAELGANLVVQAAAADPLITDIVLLSAGMNLEGVTSPGAMETYGNRPALAVAASGDAYATRSADVLERKATGTFYTEMVQGDASGVRMLTRDPQLEGKIIAWLNGTYDLEGQRASRTVTSEQAGAVETTGVRFGE